MPHLLYISRLFSVVCLHPTSLCFRIAACLANLPDNGPHQPDPAAAATFLSLLILQKPRGEALGLTECLGPQESHRLQCTRGCKDAMQRGGALSIDSRQVTHRSKKGDGLESLSSKFKICFQGVSVIGHLQRRTITRNWRAGSRVKSTFCSP